MNAKRKTIDGNRYYTIRGKRFVSVTTFLKVVGKPFLMAWYANKEREHILSVLDKLYEEKAGKAVIRQTLYNACSRSTPLAAVEFTEKAGRFGNKIHASIECYLNKDPRPKLNKRQKKCFKQFLKWWKASGFKLISAEKVVFNKKLGYAGTMDALVSKKKKRIVIDWKTGKSIYPEHYFQNVAYVNCDNVVAHEGLLVHIPRDGSPVKTYPVIPGQKNTPTMDRVKAILTCWRAVTKQEK